MKRALLAAAVVGGGVAVARRRAPAPPPGPGLPTLPAGRETTVTTEDGVALHVVSYGAVSAPTATVVLAHGYVQSSRLWAGQVRDLVDQRPDLQVVTYDQRGHGRSGRTERSRATLQQLGRDLVRVLDAVAPDGPVVLAGHSMGGMTVMALAEERPDLFEGRIVGAAFVGTSAGQLDAVTHGLPRPVATLVKRALPSLNEAAVRAELRGRTRYVGPADAFMIFPRTADQGLVREALDVHRECSAETVAAFLATFSDHDRADALAALAHVPCVVLAGDRDRLCPVEHSRAIAAALPDAELVVFPGVGHMVHMERRAEVSRHLVRLVDRALTPTR